MKTLFFALLLLAVTIEASRHGLFGRRHHVSLRGDHHGHGGPGHHHRVWEACASDLQNMCPGAESHHERFECMVEHRDELSDACRVIVDGKRACHSDAERLCPGMHGHHRHECLQGLLEEVSQACRSFLAPSMPAPPPPPPVDQAPVLTLPEIPADLQEAIALSCSSDREQFCATDSSPESLILCFRDHWAEITSQCSVMITTGFPCVQDIMSICPSVNSLQEAALCLSSNAEALSAPCSISVMTMMSAGPGPVLPPAAQPEEPSSEEPSSEGKSSEGKSSEGKSSEGKAASSEGKETSEGKEGSLGHKGHDGRPMKNANDFDGEDEDLNENSPTYKQLRTVRIIYLVGALLIGILVGILITVLCMACCRHRSRKCCARRSVPINSVSGVQVPTVATGYAVLDSDAVRVAPV